jgi:excisionase family DNA binding protein
VTVEDRLRTLADALPDGAAVTLPVSLIWAWLIHSGSANPHNNEADMTVAEVASLLSRSPQTVRTWIRRGNLDAYKLRGKEYRVTRDALEAFLALQRRHVAPRNAMHSSSGQPANLRSWRSVRSG